MAHKRPRLYDQLASDVAEYLRAADQSAGRFDEDAIRPTCSSIEYLLSGQFEQLPDFRGQWIDGILPRTVESGDDRIRLFGEAILVVSKSEWTLRPVLADLSLTEMSVIRLAGASDATPYPRDRAEELKEPSDWPHFFVVDLTS